MNMVGIRNSAGKTPLHLAVQEVYGYDNTDKVQFLIDSGADVNAVENEYGETPLHYAVHLHNLAMVKLLIANGASVDINSTVDERFYLTDKFGQTPIELAENIRRLFRDEQRAGRMHKKDVEKVSEIFDFLQQCKKSPPITSQKDKTMQHMQQWTFVKNQELRRRIIDEIERCTSELKNSLIEEAIIFSENQVREILDGLIGKEITVVYDVVGYNHIITHTGKIKSLSSIENTKTGGGCVTFSPYAPTGGVHFTAIREIRIASDGLSDAEALKLPNSSKPDRKRIQAAGLT